MTTTDRRSLTAAELNNALSALAPDTLITWTEHDSEWMRWTEWSIDSVTPDGKLRWGKIVNSGDDFDDEEDAER